MTPSRSALVGRYELFVAAATLGAHASMGQTGFRQRDVRFLVELTTNWVESSIGAASLPVQNTQVARYLERLVKEGYARKIGRGSAPRYQLVRTGLLELLSGIVNREVTTPEHFFFLLYFVRNYRQRLEAMVRAEGAQFPYSLRVELEALLDTEALAGRELKRVEREIRKLESRIATAKEVTELIKQKSRRGTPFMQIIAEIEDVHPYELNSQKPLSELMASIPPDQRQWEMEVGNLRRAEEIWEPAKRMLVQYRDELRRISAAERRK